MGDHRGRPRRARKEAAVPGGPRDGGEKENKSNATRATVACSAAKVHPSVIGLAIQFCKRFAGLERAYGQFEIAGKRGNKVEGKAALIKAPVDFTQWRDHLAGKVGLGIVPIRDDATCVFGAIDVDEYALDLKDLNRQIRARNLPLILCRSKSGGVHLYLFTSEPAPAKLIRTKLMEMAVMLGRAVVEVFPKQVRLASDKDFGSWLNMPYFGGAETDRYALDPATGKKVTKPDAFLKLADRLALTVADLEDLDLGQHEYFPSGPPCLQILARQGFPEGSRNNGLYNVAVYLRKRHGEAGWDKALDDINQSLMGPPLGHQEVAAVTKSVRRKAYEFKCNEAPICQVCNREICLTREFGIRGASGDPGVTLGELLKINTDPPLYIWDVNGERLELSAEQIMDQRQFNRACFKCLDVWPRMIKASEWQDLVEQRLTTITTQDAPEEASPEGRLLSMLDEFFLTRPHGRIREELLQGKPWTSEGWTYFRVGDFMQYLDQHRVKGFNEREVWKMLRKNEANHGEWKIKGKCLKWWAMPEAVRRTEPLDVPQMDDTPP